MTSSAPPSDRVRVAVVQTGPAGTELEANLARATALVRDLRPRPHMIVFPELFARPFWCVGLADPAYLGWAERLDGPTIEVLSDQARRLGAYVVAPFFERGDVEGAYFNSAAVIGPDGALVPGRLPDGGSVSTFRKHAISSYRWDGHVNDEKFYFRPGPGLPVFETDIGPVGVLICYDRWYPEAWRVLALEGARIVFVPNTSEGYVSDMFVPLMRVSAAQHQLFAVAANRSGAERVGDVTTTYYGRSCIVGPLGQVLAEAEADPDVVIQADLDLKAIAEARQRLWIYRDRRPELYGPLARSPGMR